MKRLSIEVKRSHTNIALAFAEKQHELLEKINLVVNLKEFIDIPKPDSVSTPIQEFRSSVKPIIDEFEDMLKECSRTKYSAWKAKNEDKDKGAILVSINKK